MSTRFLERMERKAQTDRLEELTASLKEKLQTVYEASAMLREIVETKIYQVKYKTFDEYCKTELGFSQRTARRLIKDASGSSKGQNASSGDKTGSKLDDDEDPDLKSIRAALKTWNKRIEDLGRRKPGGKKWALQLKVTLRAAFAEFWKKRAEPDREIEPPREALCPTCSLPVFWVTTAKFKSMMVAKERTVMGRFDLNGGLAVYVKDQELVGGERQPLYERHGHETNGKPEEPLPD